MLGGRGVILKIQIIKGSEPQTPGWRRIRITIWIKRIIGGVILRILIIKGSEDQTPGTAGSFKH